jgi:hypothetical protein
MEEKQKKELERKMKELRRRIGELGLMHRGRCGSNLMSVERRVANAKTRIIR